LIGVNLLREGLDLPEVTLVAILDADKEGFLRSRVSLIQTMGRAARNIRGSAILYADHITDSMKSAIDEITRRREYQLEYNSTHKVTPKNIIKPVRIKIVEESDQDPASLFIAKERTAKQVQQIDTTSLTAYDREKLVKKLTRNMKRYATDLNFEAAIAIRDKLREIKGK